MENPQVCYQRFLSGDNDALTQLIHMYRDGLMLYLSGYTGNLCLAEELTEEVFVKLVLKRPKFAGRSIFKTWLYKVGRNVALDHLRRHRQSLIPLEECGEISDEEKELEQAFIAEEDRILLHRTMRKLKPEYRQILWLVYFEGFSLKEAAGIMGKTTHNTETLVYRARKALKEKLMQEGYVYEEL